MTHPHDPFLKDALDRIHAQRDDQPPDHAKDAHDELVYDQRCRHCRGTTAQPPSRQRPPLPGWLERDLDRLAAQKEQRNP